MVQYTIVDFFRRITDSTVNYSKKYAYKQKYYIIWLQGIF